MDKLFNELERHGQNNRHSLFMIIEEFSQQHSYIYLIIYIFKSCDRPYLSRDSFLIDINYITFTVITIPDINITRNINIS